MTEITNNYNLPADKPSEQENDTTCYICDRSVCEVKDNRCTYTDFPKKDTSTIIYDQCWDYTNAAFIRMAGSSSSEYRKIGRKMLERISRNVYVIPYEDMWIKKMPKKKGRL